MPGELAALTAQEWADKYARLLAEFDNYRKRSRETAERQSESAKTSFIVELLDVIDNFERALSTETDPSHAPLLEGMMAIDQQMRNLLAAHEVEPVDVKGQPFDPNLHEAVGVVPADTADAEANHVAEVVRAGWRRGDEVLRPARVIVAQ